MREKKIRHIPKGIFKHAGEFTKILNQLIINKLILILIRKNNFGNYFCYFEETNFTTSKTNRQPEKDYMYMYL